MNMFRRELKAHRKSLLIWCVGVVFLIASGMAKYASLSTTDQSLNDLMGEMPKSLQAIMGSSSLDLATAIGYFGVLYVYLIVMAGIHAAMLGANIIAKEERDKTTEFLLVKPISRSNMITAKLLAALVNMLIFNLMTFITSVFMVQQYSNGAEVTADITTLMAGMYLLQLIFMAIGTAIAALAKNPKSAPSMATGVLLIAFILSIAVNMSSRLETLKYLTPFKYFEAKNLIGGGELATFYVILSIIIVASLFAVTYIFYKKRDLNV